MPTSGKKRRLIYQLNQARHSMMKTMDARCISELGISVVQLSALMALQEKDNCLMKELAQTLMLDKSAITGLAKRMQEKDLIKRVPCPNDSRASRLQMTTEGKDRLSQGFALLAEANELMTQGFSEAELDTVSRYLEHLTQRFSAS